MLVSAAVGCSESEGGGEGGAGGSGSVSEGQQLTLQAASRLRSCNLLTEGKVNLDDLVDESQLCYARCIVDLESCDDLERVFCDDNYLPLTSCFSECEEAEGDFTCDDGETIPASWECDFEEDCADASDEADCEGLRFTCEDGASIPADWKCDQERDCDDGSDEVGCPPASVFTCGDGEEIPTSWECDFEEDCDDGSDEAGCAQFICE